MVCEGESVKFAFIAEMDVENDRKPREERFPVIFMCETLEVSRQGYYAWKKRAPSARQKEDVTLTTLIVAIHDAHKGRYGIDRIHADLARNGYQVSPKRVRRLARAAGLRCVHPRPYKTTTVPDPANACGLVDLVGRDFVPGAKDQLWYGDITYIFTMSGWAYLATVIDGYSRKVVGWSVADHMREELVIDAFRMAVANRRPGTGEVVFHSDRGAEDWGRSVMCALVMVSSWSGRPEDVPVPAESWSEVPTGLTTCGHRKNVEGTWSASFGAAEVLRSSEDSERGGAALR